MKINIPKRLDKLMFGSEDSEILKLMLYEAAKVYRSLMSKRFKLFADGGGNWKPLSPATIKKRRHGKGGGNDKILIDTAGLVKAVGAMTGVGVRNTVHGNYISVGFSDDIHDEQSGETYQDIANFQHAGGTTMIDGREVRVPARRILTMPTPYETTLINKVVAKVFFKCIEKK